MLLVESLFTLVLLVFVELDSEEESQNKTFNEVPIYSSTYFKQGSTNQMAGVLEAVWDKSGLVLCVHA